MIPSIDSNMTAKLAETEQLTPVWRLGVAWPVGGTLYYTTHQLSTSIYKPRILDISNVSGVTNTNFAMSLSDFSVTLDDTSGEIKTKLCTSSLDKAQCGLYLGFMQQDGTMLRNDANTADNWILVVAGKVKLPYTWLEGDRKITIQIETLMSPDATMERPTGYTLGSGETLSPGDQWPIAINSFVEGTSLYKAPSASLIAETVIVAANSIGTFPHLDDVSKFPSYSTEFVVVSPCRHELPADATSTQTYSDLNDVWEGYFVRRVSGDTVSFEVRKSFAYTYRYRFGAGSKFVHSFADSRNDWEKLLLNRYTGCTHTCYFIEQKAGSTSYIIPALSVSVGDGIPSGGNARPSHSAVMEYYDNSTYYSAWRTNLIAEYWSRWMHYSRDLTKLLFYEAKSGVRPRDVITTIIGLFAPGMYSFTSNLTTSALDNSYRNYLAAFHDFKTGDKLFESVSWVAYEARAGLRVSGTTIDMVSLSFSSFPSAIATITEAEIIQNSIELVSNIEVTHETVFDGYVRQQLSLSMGLNDDVYTYTAPDAATRGYSAAPSYRNRSMAHFNVDIAPTFNKMVAFWAYRKTNQWKRMKLKVTPKWLALQIYDIVLVTLSDTAFLGVLSARGIVVETSLDPKTLITELTIEFDIKVGSSTPDLYYWSGPLG